MGFPRSFTWTCGVIPGGDWRLRRYRNVGVRNNGCRQMYSKIFDGCVTLLNWTAAVLNPVWPGGMDYVKINVLLFCVLLPGLLLGSIFLNVVLLSK